MQWDNTKNAGFTKGSPWLKLNPDYVQRNVKAQLANPNSILNYYKKLIALRQSWSSLRRGKLTLLGGDPSVLAYVRSEQDDPILVLLNMSEEKSLFRGDNFEPLSEGATPEFSSGAGHSGTRSEFESQPLACVARQKAWKVLASTHSVATENFPSLRLTLKPFEGLKNSGQQW